MSEQRVETDIAALKPVGRPPLFRPEYVQQAQALARLGLTDPEMASVFDVSVRTLHRWKIDSEEFCHALTLGKEHADNRVARTLYQKAVGYDYVEQQAFKVKCGQYEEKVEVVEVERHMPAEAASVIFWLKNRRKGEWRDRIEHTGADGGAIQIDQRRSLDPRLLSDDQREVMRQVLATALEQLGSAEGEVIEGEYEEKE